MTDPVSLSALAQMRCSHQTTSLSADELAARLADLPGWAVVNGALEKTFSFADFHATMAFVNALAYVAHREDHHPDLLVGYNRCSVRWVTHSAGGISLNDCICAAKVDALLA